MKKFTLFPKLFVIVFVSCFIILSFLYAQKIKIKTENGVQVVYNPKKPAPPPGAPKQLILTEDLSIGEDEVEDYIFSEIGFFDVDGEGNIYVLDWRDVCVKVFDKNGKHIRTFGKKGQGPGEIMGPSRLYVTERNEILIYDTANRRISFFSLNGECLREISVGKYMFAWTIPDSKGNIIGRSLVLGKEPMYEVIKFDQNLDPILTVKTISASGMDPYILRMVTPRFDVRVMHNDHIAWGNSSKYEIFIVNPEGKTVRKIVKDYNPVKITEEEKEEWKKSFEGRRLPPGIKFETSNYQNPYWYFICDDEGRMFARTYEKDKDGNFYYDVFDPEGRYIAKFSLPENEVIYHVKKNKMYILIRENEEGIPVVKRYSMEWR